MRRAPGTLLASTRKYSKGTPMSPVADFRHRVARPLLVWALTAVTAGTTVGCATDEDVAGAPPAPTSLDTILDAAALAAKSLPRADIQERAGTGLPTFVGG